MCIENLLIGLAMVAIAGFTRGFSGFGSAMILAPGLSLLFNPQQIIATVILLEITAGVGLLPEAVKKDPLEGSLSLSPGGGGDGAGGGPISWPCWTHC